MNIDSSRVWSSSIIVPSHPATEHESHKYNPHNPNPPFAPPSMSQPQPSYISDPNSAHPAPHPSHYPPGHAYRRSHSNSPFRQTSHPSPYPIPSTPNTLPPLSQTHSILSHHDGPRSPKQETYYHPSSAELFNHAQALSSSPSPGTDGSTGPGQYNSSVSVTRLPPILQVEKKQVTTSATLAASASRRRNEANFECPVPECRSTFTRRFNLRGHLRSHTEERPYVCEWPGCGKGFARQHDCKRHQALHTTRPQSNICPGCKKTFSRLDALNRHLRSEGGAECRQIAEAHANRVKSESSDTQVAQSKAGASGSTN